MEQKREKTLSEHREHFARFVALLTGELGVEAVFGEEGGSSGYKRIVLPKIEGLDSKRLDFLYALCLREAGLLSMSKRSVASIASHATQGELATSFAIESGRVERALMRKFAGAAEILDQHWKREAADPKLGAMAFGIDPTKASLDQVFPFVAKWALVGKPSFGWDKLFSKASWDRCVEAIESEPMKSMVSESRLRKWEDARDLAGHLWAAWVERQGVDGTKRLTPTPKAQALVEAERVMREVIPQAISGLIKERDDALSKAQAARDKAKAIIGTNQERLNELKKSIYDMREEIAPFEAVAGHLAEAHEIDQEAERFLQKEETKKHRLEQLQAQADKRKADVQQSAKEQGEKDGQTTADIKKALEEQECQREKARAAVEKLPAELAACIAELETKLAVLDAQASAKQADMQARINQESEKAGTSSGSKKEALERKVEELRSKLSEARAKARAEREKSVIKAQEARDAQALKTQSAVEHAEQRVAELRDKLEKAEQAALLRQERAEQKAAPTSTLQNKMAHARSEMSAAAQRAQDARQQAEQARSDAHESALSNKRAAGMSEEELIKKITELQAALKAAEANVAEIQAPAAEAAQEARDAKKLACDVNKKALQQAHQSMQALQDSMDAQGIPCELVERLEEIDGWEQANEAQRQFDKTASEQLGEPVVNGSGGGHGNRDALEEIALRAQGIEEINPNEIFSGVEKLSPLSGFSNGEANRKGGEVQNERSGEGFFSVKPHLVWRKDRDKVISAPCKDQAVVKTLTTRYATEIAQVKKVFQAKMKPSFKTRFRGGREEGQLDGRAIWKLAANQGDDFYETDIRKPDNKAAASILVDISGSLSCLGPKAEELVRACALLLSEGLSSVNIDHEILGHCAPYEPEFGEQKISATFNRKSCRLETVVAKNFGDKSKAGIASLELQQADNCDGEAVRLAAARLKKRPGKKKMLFIISDGKPFMQDADVEILDEDLRRALLDAAAQKMIVVSIGFGPNGHPVLGSEHIGIETVEELVKALESRLGAV